MKRFIQGEHRGQSALFHNQNHPSQSKYAFRIHLFLIQIEPKRHHDSVLAFHKCPLDWMEAYYPDGYGAVEALANPKMRDYPRLPSIFRTDSYLAQFEIQTDTQIWQAASSIQ